MTKDSDWIFLSKDLSDEYINYFASGSGCLPVSYSEFDYESSTLPLVIRGILKHKLIKKCWSDSRDFYYVDSGYFGNNPCISNPNGYKIWHRVVKNDIQSTKWFDAPADRYEKLKLNVEKIPRGKNIVVALPDEKPMKFYGIDRNEWISGLRAEISKYSSRPVIFRERPTLRNDRVFSKPLLVDLQDAHCLITYNSNAAVESSMYGIPSIALAPSHSVHLLSSSQISEVESIQLPSREKIEKWLHWLAYNQFSVDELRSGRAREIIEKYY